MAKKTNKTSHVLNLITGSQPPVASSGETQPSSSASGETQQEGSAAEEPVRVPSANVTVVDPREEGKLAEEIQKNLIRELEKEQEKAADKKDGKKEDKKEEGRYLRREFSYTRFQQAMILPDDVVKEKIQARMEHGVLTIDIPKQTVIPEEKNGRTIEIK